MASSSCFCFRLFCFVFVFVFRFSVFSEEVKCSNYVKYSICSDRDFNRKKSSNQYLCKGNTVTRQGAVDLYFRFLMISRYFNSALLFMPSRNKLVCADPRQALRIPGNISEQGLLNINLNGSKIFNIEQNNSVWGCFMHTPSHSKA